MKRNRIVINLEQLAGRRRKSSGGGVGRPLFIISMVLVVVIGGLALGGYFWWRHYQSSPTYSLALLVDAVQRNDSVTADQILDTDKICNDFVGQVRQKLPGNSVDSSVLPLQFDAIKASVSEKLKATVHDQLMKELRELTDVAAGKPFIIVALATPRFVDFKEQDKLVSATVNIKDEQIQLTMQPTGDRWRIVAVRDDKLAKMVADSLIRSVPANGPQLQDAIEQQLNKLRK